MSHNNRIEWVDRAKGLGIILVVYGHVMRGLYNAGLPVEERSYFFIDRIIYSFHMPLFFFISGLFFLNGMEKYSTKEYLYKKVIAIFIPFVIWSLIQSGIEVSLSSLTNGGLGILDIINSLWIPRAQFWFLYTLFFIFIINIILVSLHRVNIFILLFISIFINLAEIRFYYQPITSVLTNIFYFNLAVLFNMLPNKNKHFSVAFYVFCLVIFCTIHFLIELGYIFNTPILKMLIALMGIIVIIFFSQIKFSIIEVLGKFSMTIYLLHVIFGSGARIILDKFLDIDNIFLHSIIGVFIGLFIPILIFNYLKSTPYKILFGMNK